MENVRDMRLFTYFLISLVDFRCCLLKVNNPSNFHKTTIKINGTSTFYGFFSQNTQYNQLCKVSGLTFDFEYRFSWLSNKIKKKRKIVSVCCYYFKFIITKPSCLWISM